MIKPDDFKVGRYYTISRGRMRPEHIEMFQGTVPASEDTSMNGVALRLLCINIPFLIFKTGANPPQKILFDIRNVEFVRVTKKFFDLSWNPQLNNLQPKSNPYAPFIVSTR